MPKVKLTPIAMRRPTDDFIYAPSKIRSSVEVSKEEFNLDYADSGKAINVSFESDGISNPKSTTAYSGWNKMKGRFIIK